MTLPSLVIRSLAYHRARLAAFGAGLAVTVAIVAGALSVGDSLRGSLAARAARRTGADELALDARDAFVREALARELSAHLGVPVAGAVRRSGVASCPRTGGRAGRVQVLGVAPGFEALAPDGRSAAWALRPSQAVVNRRLAALLGAAVGDEIVVRVERPSLLPRDAVLASSDRAHAALRTTVARIGEASELAELSLDSTATGDASVFVSRAALQAELDRTGRVNLLLVGRTGSRIPAPGAAAAALAARLAPADAGVVVSDAGIPAAVQVASERVFLPPGARRAVAELGPPAAELLTYFVDAIASGARSTPYSFVAGIHAPDRPELQVSDTEILLTPWCADDLEAAPGSRVVLRYHAVVAPARSAAAGRRERGDRDLEVRETSFTLRRVLPSTGAVDRWMMPPFPGLAGATACRDWDPGLPIDLSLIRPRDEEYWRRNGGTPKAVVSLAAARRMWASRFGDTTAIRWRSARIPARSVEQAIARGIAPQDVSLVFEPVADRARAAHRQAMDFPALFLGLSSFLIASALILTGLLARFGERRRDRETGALLATGWPARRILRFRLSEGAAIGLPAAAAGVALGMPYAGALVDAVAPLTGGAASPAPWGLAVVWSPIAAAAGAASGLVAALGMIAIGVGRAVRAPVRDLVAGDRTAVRAPEAPPGRRRAPDVAAAAAVLAAAGVGATLAGAWAAAGPMQPVAFLAAGALLLVAGILLTHRLIARLDGAAARGAPSIAALAARNLARRPGRSLAVAAVLACGTFPVVALESHRLSAPDPRDRASGTGGFPVMGETTLPLYRDLGSPAGLADLGIAAADLSAPIDVVALRVRDGDDASCRNPNRPVNPRLVAVDPGELARRRAFAFVAPPPAAADPAAGWRLLDAGRDDDGPVLAAVADHATLTYALGLSIGDSIASTDERGRPLALKVVASLAGSVLQGALVVGEAAFLSRFPSSSGHRMFLVESPADPARVAAVLSRASADRGGEFSPAVQRLAEYQQVQNTYISVFQVLTGLGLLLGCAGLGLLIIHGVLERRSELALMQAVGFSAGTLRRMLFLEHALLFAAGLALGTSSGTLAALPAWRAAGAAAPWGRLLACLLALAAAGLAALALAARLALSGSLVAGLRRE
jgi:hypothetical protein